MGDFGLRQRTLELLTQLATDAAAAEAMAEDLSSLRKIAETTGSMVVPTMRHLANNQRIRALEHRGHAAALAEEYARSFPGL